MDVLEFKQVATASAKQYYEFLDKNGRGLSRIEVNKKIKNDDLFVLHINQKIIYDESVLFEVCGTKYTTFQIKLVEYDPDKNILIINPLPELRNLISQCKATEIIILSDLKFLVKRVEDWYKRFGGRIEIPNSVLENPKDLNFLYNQHPSKEQTLAIQLALTHPFTYVWGAPGTGKTQFVLAYCIMSYIKRNEKILIVAPTNNAIEQVLYGVLPVLDKAGITHDKILRLGTPTKKFAGQYTEICEEAGLQRYLNEITNHIIRLRKAIKIKKFADLLFSLSNEILPLMYSLIKEVEWLNNHYSEANEASDLLEVKTRLLSIKQKEVTGTLQQLERLSNEEGTFSFKIKSTFSQSAQQVLQIDKHRLQQTLDQQYNKLKNLQSDVDRQRTLVQGLMQTSKDTSDIDRCIVNIKSATKISSKLSRITANLNIQNVTSVLQQLEEKLVEGHYYIDTHRIGVEQYLLEDEETLLEKISDFKNEYENVAKRGTKNRMNKAICIACTIDGYISRFTFDKNEENDYKYRLTPTHIFMDEAGYGSLIKGITLTAHHCPVTFIGDHLQLPPVCEMNDSDLKSSRNTSVCLWAQSVLYVEDVFGKTIEKIRDDYLVGTNATFKRLQKSDLKGTYRFGNRLAKILDEFVYQNGFFSYKDADDFEIIILDAIRKPGKTRRENMAEIDVIKDFIEREKPTDYALLSPYRNQVKLLGQSFPELRRNAQIMTVHGSQGREWHTVILSVTDKDDAWFTDCLNTESKGMMVINTAISRAKNRLVIACDAQYWRQQPQQLIGRLAANALTIE